LAVIDSGRVKAELGDAGSRSLKQIEDARPASRALQARDVAGEVRGELEEIADRAGPLGAGLMRLGPAGLAAAAAIGAVTLGLKGILPHVRVHRPHLDRELLLCAAGSSTRSGNR
jgi:hypothetical protein